MWFIAYHAGLGYPAFNELVLKKEFTFNYMEQLESRKLLQVNLDDYLL